MELPCAYSQTGPCAMLCCMLVGNSSADLASRSLQPIISVSRSICSRGRKSQTTSQRYEICLGKVEALHKEDLRRGKGAERDVIQ